MAKKKSHKKRHNIKAKKQSASSITPSTSQVAAAVSTTSASVAVAPAVVKNTTASTDSKLLYVRRDLVRIVWLVSGFVALELVLWYLFDHTGLGSSIYSLIKI
jgi:hypothetical protein